MPDIFISQCNMHWVTCPQAITESFELTLGGACLHPIITPLTVTAKYIHNKNITGYFTTPVIPLHNYMGRLENDSTEDTMLAHSQCKPTGICKT